MTDMPQATSIESLRAGRHVDNNGAVVELSAADLQAIAQAYDPKVYEAPLVVGHPKLDAPAYGWVAKFALNDKGVLCAEPNDQTEPQFADMVNAGRFKRVSLALYPPGHSANPKPGTWYPKHVGFLGAHAPAIKGLKPVQFGEDEDGVVVLGAWESGTVARLFRSLRDWVIGKDGQETADRILPSYELDSLQNAATREALQDNDSQTAFNEGDDMTQKSVAELQAQLDETQKQLKARDEQIAAAKAAQDKAAADQRHADAVAFSESLTGKVPAEKQPVIAQILEQLTKPAADGQVLQFGEGDKAKPLADEFKGLFAGLKDGVNFGEVAKGGKTGDEGDDDSDSVQFAEGVDPDRLALHLRIEAHAKKHKVTYAEAAQAVGRKG